MSAAPPLSVLFATTLALLKQETLNTNEWAACVPPEAPASVVFSDVLVALAAMPGFDPEGGVGGEELPFWIALAQAPQAVPVAWLKSWYARFGQQGMGPDPNTLLTLWVDRHIRSPALVKNWGSIHAFEGALWLLREVGVRPTRDEARAWTESLSMGLTETSGGALRASLAQEFAALLRPAGADVEDPERPVERWVRPSEDIGALESRAVRCPSGQMRRLGDLLCLHERRRSGPASAGLALPELPHQRRDELAFNWVMFHREPLEERRLRLWACVGKKHEVLHALCERHQKLSAGAGLNAPAALEIRALMEARDPDGRSLLGFLQINRALTASDRKKATQWLIESGLAKWPDDLNDRAGRGLHHQHLRALEAGIGADPFSEKPWSWNEFVAAGLDQPEAWIGSDERLAEWAHLFLDKTLTCHLHLDRGVGEGDPNEVFLRLLDAHPLVKGGGAEHLRQQVQQALLFSRCLTCLNSCKPSKAWVDENEAKPAVQALMKACARITENLTASPLLLDITEAEWRQWGLMGMTVLLEGEVKHSAIQGTVLDILRSMDRVVRRRIGEKSLQNSVRDPGYSRRLRL